MILTDNGDLVWFKRLSDDGTPTLRAFNLRVQHYRNRPVLCWFEGEVVSGHGEGHYVIADDTYRPVAIVRAGNGLKADLHEFRLTAAGTALFTAYGTATADLSEMGGEKSGTYFFGEVQEVDVASGKLLWSWRSDQHVRFEESYEPLPPRGSGAWDYIHINSIGVDPVDGNLVVSGRNTWAVYKIHRGTGQLLWRLGGKYSDFAMRTGGHFAYQHDVTPHEDGTLTIFDNEGAPWVDPPSRGLVLSVDEKQHVSSLLREYLHSPPVSSSALGSVQELASGHTFVGWGETSYFSEYGSSGKVLLDGQLAEGSSVIEHTSRCGVAAPPGHRVSPWNGPAPLPMCTRAGVGLPK